MLDDTYFSINAARALLGKEPLTAAGVPGKGNDNWRHQLRDKYGKWIEMGGLIKWSMSGALHTGKVTGFDGDYVVADMKTPSGVKPGVKVHKSQVEAVEEKASLGPSVTDSKWSQEQKQKLDAAPKDVIAQTPGTESDKFVTPTATKPYFPPSASAQVGELQPGDKIFISTAKDDQTEWRPVAVSNTSDGAGGQTTVWFTHADGSTGNFTKSKKVVVARDTPQSRAILEATQKQSPKVDAPDKQGVDYNNDIESSVLSALPTFDSVLDKKALTGVSVDPYDKSVAPKPAGDLKPGEKIYGLSAGSGGYDFYVDGDSYTVEEPFRAESQKGKQTPTPYAQMSGALQVRRDSDGQVFDVKTHRQSSALPVNDATTKLVAPKKDETPQPAPNAPEPAKPQPGIIEPDDHMIVTADDLQPGDKIIETTASDGNGKFKSTGEMLEVTKAWTDKPGTQTGFFEFKRADGTTGTKQIDRFDDVVLADAQADVPEAAPAAAPEADAVDAPEAATAYGYTDFAGKPTLAQRDALLAYGNNGYKAVNQSLRDGSTPSADAQWTIDQINSALEQSSLNQDLELYRGVKDVGVFNGQLVPGAVVRDKGFLSTTHDLEMAESFANKKGPGKALTTGGAVFHFTAPKGTHGVDLDHVAGIPDGAHSESEILLSPDTPFTIDSVEKDNFGIWRIEAHISTAEELNNVTAPAEADAPTHEGGAPEGPAGAPHVDAGPGNGDTSPDGGEGPANPVVYGATQLSSELSHSEVVTIEDYTMMEYAQMNAALRTSDFSDEHTNHKIDTLKGVLDRSTLTKDVELHRGVQAGGFLPDDLPAGTVIADKGFMSTTRRKHIASEFADGPDTAIFHFTAPKGTHGFDVEAWQHHTYGESLGVSAQDDEGEVILPPGSGLRVVSEKKTGGVRHIYAEYMPPSEVQQSSTENVDTPVGSESTPPAKVDAPAAPDAKSFHVVSDTGDNGDGYFPNTNLWGKYGAAGVMIGAPDDSGEKKYLIVQRGPIVSSNKGKWQLPGGALNSKENDYQGAARELQEELGASNDYLAGLSPKGELLFKHDSGWHYNNITADAPTQFEPKVDGTETGDAKWVTADELRQMRDAGQLHPALNDKVDGLLEQFDVPADAPPETEKVNDAEAVDVADEATLVPAHYEAMVQFLDGENMNWNPPEGLPQSAKDAIDVARDHLDESYTKWNTLEGAKAAAEEYRAAIDDIAAQIDDAGIDPETVAALDAHVADIDSFIANVFGDGAARVPSTPNAPDYGDEPLADWEKELLGVPGTKTDAQGLIDVSNWKKVGAQAGSNPGGVYEAPDGKRYYVKQSKTDDHARSEVLARKLYDLTGVNSAKLDLVDVGDGKLGTASPLIPDAKPDLSAHLDDPAYLKKMQDGFATDAWLANWDVAGLTFDNVVTDGNGEPWRVDPGGALAYRAQGAKKGAAWGTTVGELDTLKTAPQAGKIFGDGKMSPDVEKASAQRVADVSDVEIDNAVDSTGFTGSEADQMKAILKERRDYIIDHYGLEPGGQPEPAAAPEPATEPPAPEAPAVPETPEPVSVNGPSDAFGTPLQVGAKVESLTDGKQFTIVKFESNGKYVKVTDGSKIYGRKLDKLKAVDAAAPAPAPVQPTPAPEAPAAPHPIDAIPTVDATTTWTPEPGVAYELKPGDKPFIMKSPSGQSSYVYHPDTDTVSAPSGITMTNGRDLISKTTKSVGTELLPADLTPPTPEAPPAPASVPNPDINVNGPSALDANGAKIYIGSKVKSKTDGKEFTVVKFEGNGKYVKVTDGTKVYGRKLSTLESQDVPQAPQAPDEPTPSTPAADAGQTVELAPGVTVPFEPGDKLVKATSKTTPASTTWLIKSNGDIVGSTGALDIQTEDDQEFADFLTGAKTNYWSSYWNIDDISPGGFQPQSKQAAETASPKPVKYETSYGGIINVRPGDKLIQLTNMDTGSTAEYLVKPDGEVIDPYGYPYPDTPVYNTFRAFLVTGEDPSGKWSDVTHDDITDAVLGASAAPKGKSGLPAGPAGPKPDEKKIGPYTYELNGATTTLDLHEGDKVYAIFDKATGQKTTEFIVHSDGSSAGLDGATFPNGDQLIETLQSSASLVVEDITDEAKKTAQGAPPVSKPSGPSLPDAYGQPAYIGSTVKSMTDGKLFTVVKFESNGKYARVKGSDGKVYGRKLDKLIVVDAGPNSGGGSFAPVSDKQVSDYKASPVVSDAPLYAVIKPVGGTPDVVDSNSPWYEQPSPSAPDPSAPAAWVPDGWIEDAKAAYLAWPEKSGKPLESSYNWNRFKKVMENGSLADLQHLNMKGYFSQKPELYQQAKDSIEAAQAANDAAKQKFDADYAKYLSDLHDWKVANGMDLDPHTIKGLPEPSTTPFTGGEADWTKAHPGTPTAQSVLDSIGKSNLVATHGYSFLGDSDQIEDLDVRVTRLVDVDGKEIVNVKFKLTAWAGDELADEWKNRSDREVLSGTPVKLTQDNGDGLRKRTNTTNHKIDAQASHGARTYAITDDESGAKILFYRDTSGPTPMNVNQTQNMVSIDLPKDATPADIESAMRRLGVKQATPSTENDVRHYFENRILSVFGGSTDPTKNTQSKSLREKKLKEIEEQWGVTLSDLYVGTGNNGRVSIRLSDEKRDELIKKTGVGQVSHSVTDSHSADRWMSILTGPQAGLQPTTFRFLEGGNEGGMSSDTDWSYGSSDYLYTRVSHSALPTEVVGIGQAFMHPKAIFGRTELYGNPGDGYGKHSSNRKIYSDLQNKNVYEFMIKNGVDVGSLWYVTMYSNVRDEVIKRLKAKGITSINGIPIEDFILSEGMAVPAVDDSTWSSGGLQPLSDFLQPDPGAPDVMGPVSI